MRERIKAVATDLFIAHGLRGLTFGLLAERIGIPRPNVHYYFANKNRLAEEVLSDYAAGVIALYDAAWTVTHRTLPEKFEASLAAIRERYRRFNPHGHEGQPWGLLTRFQTDRDALTPAMLDTLRKAGSKLDACGVIAVKQAMTAKELIADTPEAQVALLITNVIRFTGPLTLQAGGFQRVEAHYDAMLNTIGRAYGTAKFHAAVKRLSRQGIPTTDTAAALG